MPVVDPFVQIVPARKGSDWSMFYRTIKSSDGVPLAISGAVNLKTGQFLYHAEPVPDVPDGVELLTTSDRGTADEANWNLAAVTEYLESGAIEAARGEPDDVEQRFDAAFKASVQKRIDAVNHPGRTLSPAPDLGPGSRSGATRPVAPIPPAAPARQGDT